MLLIYSVFLYIPNGAWFLPSTVVLKATFLRLLLVPWVLLQGKGSEEDLISWISKAREPNHHLHALTKRFMLTNVRPYRRIPFLHNPLSAGKTSVPLPWHWLILKLEEFLKLKKVKYIQFVKSHPWKKLLPFKHKTRMPCGLTQVA